ncbi:hypothetical protein [uncultured Maribacter sp.]|uniref:hypothetical protein n=1 Tax=uncultured Maribacter sp. TaxID=431308 RepID=UPI0026216862|nr:hypothetical protein [uncultured Maribacter sp.]
MNYFFKLPLTFLLLILFTACSEEDANVEDKLADVDLLIGEWNFVSEHSYYCDTDEIETSRPGDVGVINTYTFKADGTYIEIVDGEFYESGEWKKNEDGTYKITPLEDAYEDDLEAYDIKSEFDGKDVLKWGMYGCEDNGSETYEYAKYERK